jgi:hypothetical protein
LAIISVVTLEEVEKQTSMKAAVQIEEFEVKIRPIADAVLQRLTIPTTKGILGEEK